MFRVFYIPSRENIELFRNQSQESPEESALTEICSGQGIQLTSFTRLIAATQSSVDDLYFGEGHWKPRTHALVSSTIALSVQSDLETARRSKTSGVTVHERYSLAQAYGLRRSWRAVTECAGKRYIN
jgi:hypothetical protein